MIIKKKKFFSSVKMTRFPFFLSLSEKTIMNLRSYSGIAAFYNYMLSVRLFARNFLRFIYHSLPVLFPQKVLSDILLASGGGSVL